MAAPSVVVAQCLCGSTEVEGKLPPLFRSYCHCTLCRRLHRAEVVPFVGFKDGDLRVTKGEELLTGYATSESMTRFHCSKCGCALYNKSHLEDYKFCDVPLEGFRHGPDGQVMHRELLAPTVHIHYDRRVKDVQDSLDKFVGTFERPYVEGEASDGGVGADPSGPAGAGAGAAAGAGDPAAAPDGDAAKP